MAPTPNLSIFLVDDDIFCLTLYKQFLRKLGYLNVTAFTSGDDCLANLSMEPRVAFLDYNMEGMNGIDVLKKLKTFDESIVVFLISGQEDAEVAAIARASGAVDYIVKSSINPARIKIIMEMAEEHNTVTEKQPRKSIFTKLKEGLGI